MQQALSSKLESESYLKFLQALNESNVRPDTEVVMVTNTKVLPDRVKEFERIVRLMVKEVHKTAGHISTCIIKPRSGEFTYTIVIKFANRDCVEKMHDEVTESGVEFYKLLTQRDSLLAEPPRYQIESGYGTWVESDGNAFPLTSSTISEETPDVDPHLTCDNPIGLKIHASFVTPTKGDNLFKCRYQRNNKKGGQKNLRCFPKCRSGAHVASGFCGDSVKVHVIMSRVTQSGGVKICPFTTVNPSVLAFSRFIRVDGSTNDIDISGPVLTPGSTILKSDLQKYIRDKKNPLRPFLPGVFKGASLVGSMQSAIFEFNAECKAWHYGWLAPRGQGQFGAEVQHAIEIIFFKRDQIEGSLYCMETLQSDSFSIHSSRRAMNPIPDKSISTPGTTGTGTPTLPQNNLDSFCPQNDSEIRFKKELYAIDDSIPVKGDTKKRKNLFEDLNDTPTLDMTDMNNYEDMLNGSNCKAKTLSSPPYTDAESSDKEFMSLLCDGPFSSLVSSPPSSNETNVSCSSRDSNFKPRKMLKKTISQDDIPWTDLYSVFDQDDGECSESAPTRKINLIPNADFCVLPIK